MMMNVRRPELQEGAYALEISASLDLLPAPVAKAQAGLCRFGEGTRSPPQGLRASAAHEIAYVVRGRVRVETASGTFDAAAGDVLTTSPAEPHSTTALEDTELFFVLLDPK